MEQFKKLIFEFIGLHNGKEVKTDNGPASPIRLAAAYRQKQYRTESCHQIWRRFSCRKLPSAFSILLLSTEIETPKARWL